MAKKVPASKPTPTDPDDEQPGDPIVIPERWTVMVFMGIETEDGNAPMLQPAIDDLVEMATIGSGSPPDTSQAQGQAPRHFDPKTSPFNIFVQTHTRHEVRRGCLQHDDRGALKAGGLGAKRPNGRDILPVVPGEHKRTDKKALERFIKDVLDETKHECDNPKHCSMLVLWGHAYNFAIGKAPRVDGIVDALDFVEVNETLRNIQQELRATLKVQHVPKFDIIAFDACDVATAEVAYELAPFADYLIASEVGVPIPGWPYDKVLERLRLPKGRVMNPPEFGTWTVNRFCQAYSTSRGISLSMLKLTKAGDLMDLIGVLSEDLLRYIGADPERKAEVGDLFLRAMTEVDKPYVDVADMCLNLAREIPDARVRVAASALGDFLVAVPPPRANEESSQAYPFVVAHGRNSGESAKLNGLSLYAPHLAPEEDSATMRKQYGKFQSEHRTSWGGLVHSLVQPL